ncbi:MAG: large conductance mechanosensitive channel protein MscL [Candidatus Paceibacterota bacterium]|jgi:large conductance mechanosensitive channel
MVNDFVDFVRKQGVVGLAVGFILGGAVSKLVSAIVTDLINPLLGVVLGKVGDLKSASLTIGSAVIKWGDFVATLIDFLVIALVVYYGVKVLGLDKLDKPKEEKPK